MSSNTPRNIALKAAVSIGVLVAVITLVLHFLFEIGLPIFILFVLPVATAFIAYFIIYSAIEKFIYQKVKIIYKTIHRMKVTPDQELGLDMKDDVLEDVKKEVADWAEDQVEEITALRAKDTFRREFIGNLAHELKTPIFNIQGYVLTLLDGAINDPKHNKKFLKKAAKGVDRMVGLIEDLDSVAKLESGAFHPEKEIFDIVQISREIIESLEEKSQKQNINLTLKNPNEKSILVNADLNRIEQVLVNLIVNSMNYGKENGNTEIRFYDMEDNILIEVSDDGIGIKNEFLPRVFERFFRVDKSRSRDHGGSGLGLSIVKHIIEAHDQTINVRSTPDVGSTFSFTLEKG